MNLKRNAAFVYLCLLCPRVSLRSMNLKRNAAFVCLCVLLFAGSDCFANPRPGKTVSFNQDWRFHLGDVNNAQDAGFNDSQWRQLDLPHDWSIEGPFDERP